MTDMLAHLWENKSHINSSVSLPSPRLQIVFLQLYFDTDTSVCIQIGELSPHGKTITKSFIQMERQTALHDLVISRRVRHLYQWNLKIISVICVMQLCKNVKMVNVGSDLSLSVKKKKFDNTDLLFPTLDSIFSQFKYSVTPQVFFFVLFCFCWGFFVRAVSLMIFFHHH